jgi:hypothetical protein
MAGSLGELFKSAWTARMSHVLEDQQQRFHDSTVATQMEAYYSRLLGCSVAPTSPQFKVVVSQFNSGVCLPDPAKIARFLALSYPSR